MSATTSSYPSPFPSALSGEQMPSPSVSNDSSPGSPLNSAKSSDPPKQKMRDFEWGGNLIRKTLPARIIPAWLDPLHVDVDDPKCLPKCWFGVPFVADLVFGYAERVGLASYYTREVVRAQPGDLDIFETWARLEVWFEKQSGLKLDWILVWGERFPILTFW